MMAQCQILVTYYIRCTISHRHRIATALRQLKDWRDMLVRCQILVT